MAVSSYPVVWLDEAKRNKNDIRQYLEKNWSNKEIRGFFRILDKRISLIASNPKMSPKTQERGNVRRSVLNKQTTLYYRFDGHQIEILYLFDNRKNPNNL